MQHQNNTHRGPNISSSSNNASYQHCFYIIKLHSTENHQPLSVYLHYFATTDFTSFLGSEPFPRNIMPHNIHIASYKPHNPHQHSDIQTTHNILHQICLLCNSPIFAILTTSHWSVTSDPIFIANIMPFTIPIDIFFLHLSSYNTRQTSLNTPHLHFLFNPHYFINEPLPHHPVPTASTSHYRFYQHIYIIQSYLYRITVCSPEMKFHSTHIKTDSLTYPTTSKKYIVPLSSCNP